MKKFKLHNEKNFCFPEVCLYHFDVNFKDVNPHAAIHPSTNTHVNV